MGCLLYPRNGKWGLCGQNSAGCWKGRERARGREGHTYLNVGVLGLSEIRRQKSWGLDRLVVVARLEAVGVCDF